jgi:hypothetical protein
MAKVRLILEVYDTVQVAETSWRDGTNYQSIIVDVPQWVADKMLQMPKNGGLRIVGGSVADSRLEVRDGEA